MRESERASERASKRASKCKRGLRVHYVRLAWWREGLDSSLTPSY